LRVRTPLGPPANLLIYQFHPIFFMTGKSASALPKVFQNSARPDFETLVMDRLFVGTCSS
jgi:hypothetical protein